MQKVYTEIRSIIGNVVTVKAEGIRNGDLALVGDSYATQLVVSDFGKVFNHRPRGHIFYTLLPCC